MESSDERQNHLERLPPEFYRAQAYVHWSMTMDDRKTGWLTAAFHARFREVLIHTMFRYSLCCPIYCCMPDHVHLLWVGILDTADQRKAARYFRKQMNIVLKNWGASFQQQPYDHVLREHERQQAAFENVVEYIARNPERAGLVPVDGFREYPYTGCVIPGAPDLTLWQPDFWDRFWKIYSYARKNGLIVT